ncbi:AAA family ATPase [Candidatus Micrarchaeota archaeon]|nr:AAA family ATPase [Candidatus Micrarchaeota archaeon]
MQIIVTGTPGTGKTVIARAVAKKLGYTLIEIKKIVDTNKSLYKIKKSTNRFLTVKERDFFNIEKGERIVDVDKLKKAIIKELEKPKNNIIIEGHLACEMHLPAKFVFVLRCNPKILRKRLQKRKYPKEKIDENLLAEMLDYCTQLARKNYKKPKIIELDTAKRNLNKCVVEIINVIKGKKKKIDDVDYNKELIKHLI